MEKTCFNKSRKITKEEATAAGWKSGNYKINLYDLEEVSALPYFCQ